MTGFILFITIIFLFVSFNKLSVLKNRFDIQSMRIEYLEKELRRVNSLLKKFGITTSSKHNSQYVEVKKQANIDNSKKLIDNTKSFETAKNTNINNLAAKKITEKEVVIKSQRIEENKKIVSPIKKEIKSNQNQNRKVSNFEKQFLENWTGILGSIILVIGVAFVGLYAVLKVSPLVRFFLINIVTVTTYILYIKLVKKVKWEKFAYWMRSISAAIFLFSCLGAGHIKGLQFINNTHLSLLIILLGVSYNIFIAYTIHKQMFSTLHVLLSLVALSVAPFSMITITLITIVSVSGIHIHYRETWDFHLLIIITYNFIYNIYWILTFYPNHNQSLLLYYAKGCALIVFLATCLNHYRELYKEKENNKISKLPMLTHILNWFFLGTVLVLFSDKTIWITLAKFSASILAFILAKQAKKRGIKWVYTVDTIISQFLMIIAIISFSNFNVGKEYIAYIITIESIFFTLLMVKLNENFLTNFGDAVTKISFSFYFIFLLLIYKSNSDIMLYKQTAMNFIIFVCFLLQYLYTVKKYKLYGSSIVIGSTIMLQFVSSNKFLWSPYLLVFSILIIAYIRFKNQEEDITNALFISIPIFILTHWFKYLTDLNTNIINVIILSLPAYILYILNLKLSYFKEKNKYIIYPFIYLATIETIIVSVKIFQNISPFAFGVLWLLLSIICLECCKLLCKKGKEFLEYIGFPQYHLRNSGHIFLFSYYLAFITIYMQSEATLFSIKFRLILEIFSSLIILYWFFFNKDSFLDKKHNNNWIPHIFFDLTILSFIFIIFYEVPTLYQPITWSITGIILVLTRKVIIKNLSRLNFYSVIFNWLASFHLAFVTSMYITPQSTLTDQVWFMGLITIILQVLYLVLTYNSNFLQNLFFYNKLSFFENLSINVRNNQNKWIYYPFFIAITVFLYFSASKTFLTLLFVFECFGIFSISIFLRENQFRIISMFGLAFSLLRLIFYDLSNSSTLTKAFVFLGVGALMLGINSLYNTFKERYKL